MEIRSLSDADTDGLRDLFYRLSPRTVYLRFFHPVRKPDEGFLHHLADVDHHGREALAAVDAVGRIVAVARYDRAAEDPSRAEIAVVVEDAWQGHGLGKQLLGLLAVRAAEEGVTTLTASVLGENRRMLALTQSVAPERRLTLDHGEWAVEIPVRTPPAGPEPRVVAPDGSGPVGVAAA